jgi:cysteine-rich repeat protein
MLGSRAQCRVMVRAPALLGLLLLAGCGAGPGVDSRPAGCGNGVVESGEECDDGNADSSDACLSTCFTPARFVAGDPHVHSQGCLEAPADPPRLLQLLAAQGIQVGAALVWGDGYDVDRPRFTGRDDPASTGERILHYDLEVSAFTEGDGGHLVMLGLHSIDFSPDPFRAPHSGLSLPAWARAQGERVVVGMAHGQFWPASGFPSPGDVDCCMPWEFPIHAARGAVSFLITERLGDGAPVDEGTFALWRALLNSGFRVALLGGSDYPCIHHVLDDTAPRTDVMAGALSYEAWLEGIRRGRTVVTLDARHHLNLRVNGAPLGSEVQARPGDVLTVSLESDAPEPTTVELLVNGAVAQTAALPAGRQVATLRVPLPASSWLFARTPRAATSAIYVLADGRPIRASAADACYLAQYTDHLSRLVRLRRVNLAEDTDSALEAYAAARAEFERRFREAGGVNCG